MTLKAWESGRRAPKPASQRRVADVLGLGFEDLEVVDEAGDLRRLRQARGWTRAEAAERLGVEPFTLQRVEEGLELPPDPRRMARVYGVSRMELAAADRRVAGPATKMQKSGDSMTRYSQVRPGGVHRRPVIARSRSAGDVWRAAGKREPPAPDRTDQVQSRSPARSDQCPAADYAPPNP